MNEIVQLASDITSQYGIIKRARGCFLYTAKGVRLTDLYQEGGRAILGWGSSAGTSAFTVLKNVLSRGANGSFDTDFTPRADGSKKSQLARAVSALLASERTAYLFATKKDALDAALRVSPEHTSCYKPWVQTVDWQTVEAAVIEPPLPMALPLWLLAVKSDLPLSEDLNKELLEKTQRFPAALCAAVTRSLYDLIAALKIREEKHFFVYDPVLTKYWERRGPYLYPKVPQDKYAGFVRHCLAQTLVISPVYNQPSIVPFGADRGVFRALENNPFPL